MKLLNILGITYTRKGEQKIVWFNPLTWIAYIIMLLVYMVAYNLIDESEDETL